MRVMMICAVVMASFCTGCSSLHTLFDSGESDYTIILDPEASECVEYAAQELQHWLHQISGVTVPIEYNLNAGHSGKRLVVGYNTFTQKKNLES